MVFEGVQRWSAKRRISPGDGRALPPFRWWQMPIRGLFRLRLRGSDGRTVRYAVDVRHWANLDGSKTRAHLYVDGFQRSESRVPARFPVGDGSVHVTMSSFGIRRCHFVAADGAERELEPDPRSAEGRRAQLDRDHPLLGRSISVLSVLLLVVGIGLNLLQAAEPISEIPAIAGAIGAFESPIRLPIWLNLALGLGAVLASMERALRMRSNPLLDKAGN